MIKSFESTGTAQIFSNQISKINTHEVSKKTTKNIADEQWLNFEEIVIKIYK